MGIPPHALGGISTPKPTAEVTDFRRNTAVSPRYCVQDTHTGKTIDTSTDAYCRASTSDCECVLDYIQRHVSFATFQAADAAVGAGGGAPAWELAGVRACEY